jgi:hypothetical protein
MGMLLPHPRPPARGLAPARRAGRQRRDIRRDRPPIVVVTPNHLQLRVERVMDELAQRVRAPAHLGHRAHRRTNQRMLSPARLGMLLGTIGLQSSPDALDAPINADIVDRAVGGRDLVQRGPVCP